jgi:hypothetical protein
MEHDELGELWDNDNEDPLAAARGCANACAIMFMLVFIIGLLWMAVHS